MNPRLIALSGPLKGSVFPLTEKPLTIGRTADNHICLDDELVGRHHARVWLKETRPYLRDGDSRNGTWVDGRAYLEKFLEHGDRLKLGSSIFLYFELDEPPDSLPLIIEEELNRNREKDTLRADYSSRKELQVYYRAVDAAYGCMIEALNAISDTKALLSLVLEEAFKIIPAKRGAFLLNGQVLGPDKWTLEVYAQRDLGMEARFTPNSKQLGEVYRQRVPIIVKDITAVICAPLIVEGRMRGVLYMDGTDAP